MASISPCSRTNGKNSVGLQRAEIGVLPSHERLYSADGAGRHTEFRLVQQRQLAVIDGASQFAEQLQSGDAIVVCRVAAELGIHIGCECPKLVELAWWAQVRAASACLSSSPGFSGEPRSASSRGHTDAQAYVEAVVVEVERFVEGLGEVLGDLVLRPRVGLRPGWRIRRRSSARRCRGAGHWPGAARRQCAIVRRRRHNRAFH